MVAINIHLSEVPACLMGSGLTSADPFVEPRSHFLFAHVKHPGD